MISTIAVIGVIAAIYFFGLYQLGMKKRLNLVAYSAYLLINDDIREGHKHKLLEFISQQDGDARRVTGNTMHAIETMADELGRKGSLMSAEAMIWKAKID